MFVRSLFRTPPKKWMDFILAKCMIKLLGPRMVTLIITVVRHSMVRPPMGLILATINIDMARSLMELILAAIHGPSPNGTHLGSHEYPVLFHCCRTLGPYTTNGSGSCTRYHWMSYPFVPSTQNIGSFGHFTNEDMRKNTVPPTGLLHA